MLLYYHVFIPSFKVSQYFYLEDENIKYAILKAQHLKKYKIRSEKY